MIDLVGLGKSFLKREGANLIGKGIDKGGSYPKRKLMEKISKF